MTKPKPEHVPEEELELEVIEEQPPSQTDKLKEIVIRTRILEEKVNKFCEKKKRK